MPLTAGYRLISLAVKELTTGSDCPGKKQRHGVILKVQLSKKASIALELNYIPADNVL